MIADVVAKSGEGTHSEPKALAESN